MIYWSVGRETASLESMGENIGYQNIDRHRASSKRPRKETAEVVGRRLLEIIVYVKHCRVGVKQDIGDLADTTEIGDWKMPDFKIACAYAAAQNWLVLGNNTLTLAPAGLAAA
jgi:hypothetical protein